MIPTDLKLPNDKAQPDCAANYDHVITDEWGDTRYFLGTALHRIGGPAFMGKDGTTQWVVNGTTHREDGPAIEWSNGQKAFYLDGQSISESEFNLKMAEKNKPVDITDKVVMHIDSFGNKRYTLNGLLHREDGPALICKNGDKQWYRKGMQHREDGPAVEYSDGRKSYIVNGNLHRIDGPALIGRERDDYYVNGTRHREDGPAVEYKTGMYKGRKEWIQKGNYHRENGPAIELPNGDKEYYVKGLLHREDGPAIDYATNKQYYLNANCYTKDQYDAKMKEKNGPIDVKDKVIRMERDDGTIVYKRNDKLHREDGPAFIAKNGDKHWYINGLRHKLDGPAIECVNGTKTWYKNDKIHREDGPAVLNKESIEYYIDGIRHREDGPAIEFHSGQYKGHKEWYKNGKRHSENGPAIINSMGVASYYLDGVCYSSEETFKAELVKRKNTPLNVDGKVIQQTTLYGDVEYRLNGLLHREDGPAIERKDGTKEWFIRGQRHRESGPAYETPTTKQWFINNQRHREDGPAIVYLDNYHPNMYYIHDLEATPEQLKEIERKMNLKTLSDIDKRKLTDTMNNKPQETTPIVNVNIPEASIKKAIQELSKDIEKEIDKVEKTIAEVKAAKDRTQHKDLTNHKPVIDNSLKKELESIFDNTLGNKEAKEAKEAKTDKQPAIDIELDKFMDIFKELTKEAAADIQAEEDKRIFNILDDMDLAQPQIVMIKNPYYWEKMLKTGHKTSDLNIGEEISWEELNNPSTKDTKPIINTTDQPSSIKQNFISAAYRVGANQITKGVKTAILAALHKQGQTSEKIAMISEMLDTEIGTSLVSFMLGNIFTYAPGLKDNAKVARLAEECRIEGMATAGNVLVEQVIKTALPVITNAISSIPTERNNKEIRVVDNSSELENAWIEEALEEEEKHTLNK